MLENEAVSLSRRRWTSRQLLDDAELRIMKWAGQNGLCFNCTRYHQTPETMDMAHRIPDTKVNRKVYGREVIDHPMNRVLTCKEAHKGCDCNAAVILNWAAADAHAARIREAMERSKPC